MENNQETKKILLENLAISIVYGTFLFAHNLLLFGILCILFSGWKLWQQRESIVKKFKWSWQTFVTSAAALFIAKVSVIHHFNSKYGIYPEYLNHSVTVWTLISASSFLAIPILLNSLKFIIIAIATRSKGVFESLKNGIYACTFIVVWYPFIMAHNFATQYEKWFLILDSYGYSDCKTGSNSLALRKDNESCYRFTFHSPTQWEMEEYSSPKPK